MSLLSDNPSKLDKLGIWVSSLCALHCVSLPVLIPLLPLIGSSIFAQTWFERTILLLSMLIGGVALLTGALKYHGKYYPLALLLLGGTTYWFKHGFGHHYEPLMITLGAGLIIFGHWLNMRLCRKCRCGHSHVLDPHHEGGAHSSHQRSQKHTDVVDTSVQSPVAK